MLMEGTTLGRLPDDGQFASEADLERAFVTAFRTTPGMALVACSAQNIDRVVTVYRAAKRTGRTLIVDAYAAEVLKATGHESIPKPVQGWPNVAVFIPQAQRVQLKRKGIAPLVDSYRSFRLWPAQLAEQAPRSVMLFRGWMMKDLERAGALGGAHVFWSQWDHSTATAGRLAPCAREPRRRVREELQHAIDEGVGHVLAIEDVPRQANRLQGTPRADGRANAPDHPVARPDGGDNARTELGSSWRAQKRAQFPVEREGAKLVDLGRRDDQSPAAIRFREQPERRRHGHVAVVQRGDQRAPGVNKRRREFVRYHWCISHVRTPWDGSLTATIRCCASSNSVSSSAACIKSARLCV